MSGKQANTFRNAADCMLLYHIMSLYLLYLSIYSIILLLFLNWFMKKLHENALYISK